MNTETDPGKEQYEEFTGVSGKPCIEYEYRTPEGELFSCVAIDLETARVRRDRWLLKRELAAAPAGEG